MKVLWGTADRVTPFPREEKIKKAFIGANLEALPQAGHLPYYENLDRVFLSVMDLMEPKPKARVLGGQARA